MPAKSEVKIFGKVPPEAIVKHWRTIATGRLVAERAKKEEEKKRQKLICEIVALLQEKQKVGEFQVGRRKVSVDFQREEDDPQSVIDVWRIGVPPENAERIVYLFKIIAQRCCGQIAGVAAQKLTLGEDSQEQWLAMPREEIQELKEVLAAGLEKETAD